MLITGSIPFESPEHIYIAKLILGKNSFRDIRDIVTIDGGSVSMYALSKIRNNSPSLCLPCTTMYFPTAATQSTCSLACRDKIRAHKATYRPPERPIHIPFADPAVTEIAHMRYNLKMSHKEIVNELYKRHNFSKDMKVSHIKDVLSGTTTRCDNPKCRTLMYAGSASHRKYCTNICKEEHHNDIATDRARQQSMVLRAVDELKRSELPVLRSQDGDSAALDAI